ncbi:hypothetical protein BGX38DRAFT_1160491 [Terfezia claveryi]|nr:hypothetical protein BGX38DRAFT_1160491 [Terfezia claveryi]
MQLESVQRGSHTLLARKRKSRGQLLYLRYSEFAILCRYQGSTGRWSGRTSALGGWWQ